MSNFHFKRASARGLAVSTVSLACLTTAAMAQEAANTSQPSPDLPPVEVPQPAPAAAPKPKKPKPALAKAKPKPPTPAPAPEVVAAPEPDAANPATALGTYNPALDVRDLELPPGTTLTTAGPVDGYRALTAISSTKTATPIERIPQSIQVVPRSVLVDQTSISIDEAVRNVSNVQSFNDLNIGNTDMAGAKIRGLKAELWLDGLVVNYATGDRDSMANVERIEVLKGPAAILYGGGSGAPAGGAINVISKLPTDRASAEAGLTFGSDNFLRPYVDINQPLSADGTVLFRITGEYTAADSFVDVLEQDRYSINPTLTLTNKTDTTLTIQARTSRYEQQAYVGLPEIVTEPGRRGISRTLFAGDPNIPRSFSEVDGVTVTLDHRFNEIWSFNVKGRWSDSAFDQKSQGPVSGTPDIDPVLLPTTFSLANIRVRQEQSEFTINPNLQAKFDAGPTQNTLLIGADYSRQTDDGIFYADFGVFPVDLANPLFITPYTDPDPSSPFFFPFFDFENVYETRGIYAQMQTTLFDRLHLLGGLRWASIDIEYLEKAGLSPGLYSMQDDKVLPRTGVVFDVLPGLSAYASYSEGMRWAGFSRATEVKPELSEQYEVGLKFNVGAQLSGTMALFEIERSNIPVIAQGFVADLTDQRARGFETDLVYQPSRNWQILANYGYVDAIAVSGTDAGKKLVEVPEHSGRAWINYFFDPDVAKGWSVGAGVYAASSQFVDTANLFSTDGYFTVDAKVGYASEAITASINVKNLTGEEYFVPYSWFGGQVAPGEDRAYYGSLIVRY